MSLTNDDLTRLRAVAERATAERLTLHELWPGALMQRTLVAYGKDINGTNFVQFKDEAEAAMYAAFDRETSLALLNEVERLRRVEAAARELAIMASLVTDLSSFSHSLRRRYNKALEDARAVLTPPESKP